MSVIDLSFDEAAFSGAVPLFPLPGAVLLPGGLLPLHVFEPRYRALVHDAAAGERLLAPALLLPGYEAEYEGAPALDPAVCVGRIAMEEELADGRLNIVVVGLRRARIVAERPPDPYRVATVELQPDLPLPPDQAAEGARRLAALAQGFPAQRVRHMTRLVAALRLLEGELPGAIAIGALVDLVADALELEPEARQALLRERDVLRRLDALGELTHSPAPGRWPPPFSRN